MRSLEDILKIDINSRSPSRDAEIEEYLRKEQERVALERYKKAVPQRYWGESIDSYQIQTEQQRTAVQVVRGFIDAVKCGKFHTLILIGAAGTGKTHLACSMIKSCEFGLYRIAPNIVEEIRRAKSFSARETEADIIKLYGETGLLVIDEIGRGIAAADEQYMLYQIINARYNTRKPTVLISNQSKKDFINYIGIAAADRLTESGQTLEFSGASYRAVLRTSNE